MAISDSQPYSPGWWLSQAMKKRSERLDALEELKAWQDGNPPAPQAVKEARVAFAEFESEAITNFAELITGSIRERMAVRDIKTAVSGDLSDMDAWKVWRDNALDVEMASNIETMLWAGDSYMIVGKDPVDDEVIITAEDPRDVVTFHDPKRQARLRAGVRFFSDDLEGIDYAIVWLPGRDFVDHDDAGKARQYVAKRPTSNLGEFDGSEWSWDGEQGGSEGLPLEHSLVPIVRFRNREGKSEFGPHLPILKRLNRFVFQLTIIVLYQAFKQRAVMLSEKTEEESGGIDVQNEFKESVGLSELDEALTSDPGSWFLLPSGATIWESTQADMNGILSAIKDDTKRLAAVARRPLTVLAPDNQSGTGAKNDYEQWVFAIRDKITRVEQGIVDLFHLVFLTMGDAERADRSQITVGWKPFAWDSLLDSAQATAQMKDVMPFRTILRLAWHMSPDEIEQVLAEQADDALTNALMTGNSEPEQPSE